MSEILFTGLDGKNPLAFLAALGVLNILADRCTTPPAPKIAWKNVGTYRPVLVDGPAPRDLLDILVEDLASFADERALDLHYKKPGGADAHDLKPLPRRYAEYLEDLRDRASRRSLAFAGAFATDVAVDNNGNTKPTALHFTAGQQEFLAMVTELQRGTNREDFEEALFGPWRYARPLPVLQWDNAQSRDYALRAGDPSKEKKLGVPGADWLAFRGLPFIRVVPEEDKIVTTGCRGGWKSGTFRWPIWNASLGREVVQSVLASSELFDLEPRVLRTRGVAVVFEASINRSDQGGYGSFSPASVASRRQERL
ncbi:MAG: hypothetical protein KF782_16800 [Labilithrix sp.]|nr:hypothetical protein [Labilithrix sp.]